MTPFLSPDDLLALARCRGAAATACASCRAINCPGWESLRADLDRSVLKCIGTLRDPDIEEPTLTEHHRPGTSLWSTDAPIAPHFFPYNRCEVWCCAACSRPFLRYTEYGGYYQDDRIREVNAALIDASRPDQGNS